MQYATEGLTIRVCEFGFFFQAEDGIRDLVRSRGLGDVYKRQFHDRSLAGVDYVYLWVDGIHLKVRLEADKVCLLVMIGVRADGSKELVALADGYRESAESWADLLRDCKRRGMQAPVLAVGDGALGFWKALHDVFPQTREQRCWFHKLGNVLAALPKSVSYTHLRAHETVLDLVCRLLLEKKK